MSQKMACYSYLTEIDCSAHFLARLTPATPASPRRQGSSQLADTLLRGMLADMWDSPSADLEILRHASGQPHLAGRADISVSTAHSHGWLACAASDLGVIGIDIELPRPGRALDEIARMAFGLNEAQRAAATGVAGFYRIWTLREALAKATGAGWSQLVDRQDRFDDGPETGSWQSEYAGSRWLFTHHTLAAGAGHLHLGLAHRAEDSADAALRHWSPAHPGSDSNPDTRSTASTSCAPFSASTS